MPRSLVYDAYVEVPAADMYRHFTTPGYWHDLVDFYRETASHTEITHFSSNESGTDVTFTHVMTAQDLPPVARRVVPGSFVVTREQHFDPFDGSTNRATGHFSGKVPAPVDITGQTLLQDSDQGCQMRLTSSCRVRIPIVGGQIENLVMGGLRMLFEHEGAFTADWITDHR